MNEWPSSLIAVGNRISPLKLGLLSNLNYEVVHNYWNACSHAGWSWPGQLRVEQSRLRVCSCLMARCEGGPVVEEPSAAFASETGLSLSSSVLRFQLWKVSPRRRLPCDYLLVRDSVFEQGTGQKFDVNKTEDAAAKGPVPSEPCLSLRMSD